MTTYLTHLVLPRTRDAAALFARLSANAYIEHQVLWELMDQPADAKRDFIYRCDMTERGIELYVMAPRPVTAPAPWQVRSREYSLSVKPGTLLRFSLRFNPTRAKKVEGRDRGVRTDMVMERYQAAGGEVPLMVVAQAAGQDWLVQRQEQLGARIVELQAPSYRRVQPVKKGASMAPLALLDVEGLLEVTDPVALLEAQTQGLGKARYAGCGLLLLRPVR